MGMSGFDINQAIREVKLLQALNYEMLDYLRTQTAWLLEHCEKYNIPLPDFEKAILFMKTSGQMLERNSPTENQQRNKTTDDSTEPIKNNN
jgi:hypothetical protein